MKPGVLEMALPYVRAMNWSLLPLLVYSATRRYLQSVHKPGVVMFALLSANIVNAAGNYLLIPRFGVEGSGWSTLGARIYMAVVLAAYAFIADRKLLQVPKRILGYGDSGAADPRWARSRPNPPRSRCIWYGNDAGR